MFFLKLKGCTILVYNIKIMILWLNKQKQKVTLCHMCSIDNFVKKKCDNIWRFRASVTDDKRKIDMKFICVILIVSKNSHWISWNFHGIIIFYTFKIFCHIT